MTYTVTVELPGETLQQYQQGASAARKQLEAFIAERLIESPPPTIVNLPKPMRDEIAYMENLDNEELQQIAQSTLPLQQQKLYDKFVKRNRQGQLTPQDVATLHAIGDEARRLTLKKSHAYMLLQWRGVQVPKLSDLEDIE